LGNPPVDKREEYNNNIQVYYGRTLKIEFTLCNDKCKTCKLIRKSEEQAECEECKDNVKYYFNKDANSYICLDIGTNCPKEYPFFTSNNSFQCFKECPEEYPFLKKSNSSICQKDCDYDDLINNECILKIKTTDSLMRIYEQLNNYIKTNLFSEYFYEGIVFTLSDDITFQLTNSIKEKSNLLNLGTRKNLSVIDLAGCENIIKATYGLDNFDSLVILKFENYYDNTTIKNVQYEIFHPHNLSQIDLSFCENKKKLLIFMSH
jgi:hypothetical protein